MPRSLASKALHRKRRLEIEADASRDENYVRPDRLAERREANRAGLKEGMRNVGAAFKSLAFEDQRAARPADADEPRRKKRAKRG